MKKHNPHLLLLDINLPVQDGFKICSKIRTFSNAPIIFVTSRNTDMDEMNSIMLGGDDFITKPYHTSILLARISSLLKRTYALEHIEFLTHKQAQDSGFVRLKTLQMNEGISNSQMIRLGSTYTRLVLIIICLTVLALQQLTDATEYRLRFAIIAILGVDKEQIGRCIRQQMSVWYGIPVIFASLVAGITLAFLLATRYESYIPYVTLKQAFMNCLSVYVIFAIVFFCYFEATYLLFQRNVSD